MKPRLVLLCNPRMCSPNSARLPLSLLHLAAALEGRHPYRILDGNLMGDIGQQARHALEEHGGPGLLALSVMPGPQVGPAIALSAELRAAFPDLPILWGGYFPSLYADAALNAPYVDLVARGPGEELLLELLPLLDELGPPTPARSGARPELLAGLRGLSYKDGGAVHNAERPIARPPERPLPYAALPGPARWLRPTFLGRRTAVAQSAMGCRYRCSFCGVVSVFHGQTRLGPPAALRESARHLRDQLGADALQLYDHNAFDSEDMARPLAEALLPLGLPWWCYARADTMARFSADSWGLLARSGLRMAYIGAESGSDAALKAMKKGSRVEHTLEVVARCAEHGVIPELSFVLGGPDLEPEAELEATFALIRRVKERHEAAEIILYFYSPTPQRRPGAAAGPLPLLASYGPEGPALPATPEEWTEPRWLRYVCHQDAPWLSPRLRRRVQDFARVLACRFPTVQDHRRPPWARSLLRALAGWRYQHARYGASFELELARRLVALKDPAAEGL